MLVGGGTLRTHVADVYSVRQTKVGGDWVGATLEFTYHPSYAHSPS